MTGPTEPDSSRMRLLMRLAITAIALGAAAVGWSYGPSLAGAVGFGELSFVASPLGAFAALTVFERLCDRFSAGSGAGPAP